ncbi:hypothetical protein [Alicyclobacillus ferrooxydans]|uniref:Uncharacterized protein n=1 Tax=Alicyclobacillus ferrooxydans TaxID=471514 RepID=A0A0P9C6S7_9BACL|nr:hypothetical protein [Alicyclobacillus ferrooxydans]KPV40848.1 hypothetical protein AN477_21380 [Alicyclobacillus ferrooxydans]
MRKLVLGIAATACLVVTGCGAGPTGQEMPVNNGLSTTGTGSNQITTGNTTTPSTTNSATTNSMTNSAGSGSASDSLRPYTGFQSQGLTVSVPQGWNSSTTTGGDYEAVTFTNPSNPKEQVRVLYSTCVGCYMGSSGKPDPTKVIGETNPSNVQVSGPGGSIANYTFSTSDSPYQGTGMVQLSTNESGYAEIDITVSQPNQQLRDAIMKSFHYAS